MNIAIAGLGFMGLTHLKALRSAGTINLTAVVSSSDAKLAGDLSAVGGNLGSGGERFDFSGVKRYHKLEELLADPEIEAVDLCLPTHLHAEAAISALRAGKHVLVEKPMGLDETQCERMIVEAALAGKVLMVAQVLRFFPAYTALAGVLESGRVGALRSAIFRRRCARPGWSSWLGDKTRSGGGVFDLLIHDVDACLWLFGSPAAVSATGYENLNSGLDTIHAQLFYSNGFAATISGGWFGAGEFPFSMEYSVTGDGGTVEFSSNAPGPAFYPSSGREVLETPEVDGYAAEIAYFAECVRESRHPDRCPPEASARAVKLTRTMLEARNRNGEKITCQL